MIELRWIVPEGTTTQAPCLQYRMQECSATEGYTWSEWADVPTVVVPNTEPKLEPGWRNNTFVNVPELGYTVPSQEELDRMDAEFRRSQKDTP